MEATANGLFNSTATSLPLKMSPAIATVVVVLVAAAVSAGPSLACNKRDESALLAFKNSFEYTTLPWPEPTDCCSWVFVGCDKATGRVTSLVFSNDNSMPPSLFLNGSLPASIGDLTALQTLRVHRVPSLRGPLPPQLTRLKNLRSLEIYVTAVSGPVPSFLSRIPSLRELALGYNNLSGTIPSSLGDLPALADLSLYASDFTGPIPDSLFSKLPKGTPATLVMSLNKLTGTIPKSFADVAFEGIYLHQNRLSGDASFLFGKSKPLTTVSLNNNDLSFDFGKVELPVGLDYIDVSHNKIYGTIPKQIAELRSLSYMDVSDNQLCGKIPSGLKFDADRYANNKCLCGAPLPPCK